MTRTLLAVSVLAATFGLVGCGESTPAQEESSAPIKTIGELTAETVLVPGQTWATDTAGIIDRRDAVAATYPLALDMNASFYFYDKSHRAYADFYIGSGGEASDEMIVNLLDPTFRDVTDAFARKDKVTAMAGEIAAYRDEVAKLGKNVAVMTNAKIAVGPYDMQQGGFSIESRIAPTASTVHWAENSWTPRAMEFIVATIETYTANAMVDNTYVQRHFIKVPEEKARTIEAYLSSKRGGPNSGYALPYRVKGYVLDTLERDNQYATFVMPETIEILHEDTKETLLVLSSDDLAKRFRISPHSMLGGSPGNAFIEKYGLE